jgi:hypothetical protein
MAKIKSFGVRVFIDGVSVGALTDASISGVDVTFIDLTTHDSSDEHKEFVSGLLDGGTLELSGKFDADNAGQIALQGGADDIEPFLVIKSDNSGMSFNAVIGGYSTTNPLDDAVDFSASAKITGEVTHVTSFTYSATLNPTGDDNDILITDASGTRTTAEIVIDSTTDRTQLTAEIDGTTVRATSGDKRVMRVTADFGSGIELRDYVFTSIISGRPSYNRILGDLNSITDFVAWNSEDAKWVFFGDITSESLSDTSFPDEATWSDGVIVEADPSTASRVITALDALPNLTAENAPGSDGTGTVAATSANFGYTPS